MIGRGDRVEHFSFCFHSHTNRISLNILLWKITKGTDGICICVLNYEFYLLWIGINKFVVKITGCFTAEKGEESLLKYIDYVSRFIMITPLLIIGFKLNNGTIAISALIVGAILQIIYGKMKKDSNFIKTKIENRLLF